MATTCCYEAAVPAVSLAKNALISIRLVERPLPTCMHMLRARYVHARAEDERAQGVFVSFGGGVHA